MDRLNLPAAVSTDSTRTCTSCPCCSSSSTLSTKPSLICVMCTRPSAVGPPSGRVTVTKAPKGAVLATVPVSHWSDATPSKAERSAAARGAPPEPAGFMERLIRPASTSTLVTRTCTSWPTSSSSQMFSTKPSLICAMCTRPSADGPPLGSVTVTKAPKEAMLATVPVCHSSGDTPWKADRSAGARRPPPRSMRPSIMVRPNFPLSWRPLIQTSTSWPSSRKSRTSSIRCSAILEMCTRPSPSAPMSTKAPKLVMDLTVPLYFWPTSSFSKGMGGYFMSLGLQAESSGPPSGSSHLTWKVPSLLAWVTVPEYICPSSGKTASTASPTL
mmetsp:Transcript_122058/g.182262  ORF Transcript_122058/g.182262 Transcript_122058/m.182262 type:complete len:328 (+) Transcript_122058:58-1041(+)